VRTTVNIKLPTMNFELPDLLMRMDLGGIACGRWWRGWKGLWICIAVGGGDGKEGLHRGGV
jgi:hypothetical protein